MMMNIADKDDTPITGKMNYKYLPYYKNYHKIFMKFKHFTLLYWRLSEFVMYFFFIIMFWEDRLLLPLPSNMPLHVGYHIG